MGHWGGQSPEDFSGEVLGWPKSSFGFFHTIAQKNLNKFFGKPNSLELSFENNYELVRKTREMQWHLRPMKKQ